MFRILITSLLVKSVSAQSIPYFWDATNSLGFRFNKNTIRYGGPVVFDLNDDGFLDIMVTHHDMDFSSIWLYNPTTKRFDKANWRLWTDMHGISALPRSPWSRNMRFTVSSGGAYGLRPSHPQMYEMNYGNGQLQEITQKVGLNKLGGRGRTGVFMNLAGKFKHPYCPDVLFTNAAVVRGGGSQQFAYECINANKYQVRPLKGYFNRMDWYATVTDLDNDGTMELLSYQNFSVQKLVAPFHFVDITPQTLAFNKFMQGVVGIAEIDYDNDGDFDLYLSRTRTGDLEWLKTKDPLNDLLLENRGGRYFDVSAKARIPRFVGSRGAAVGDFNNDGYMDIIAVQFQGPDAMLLNRGDGTFRQTYNIPNRSGATRGDMVQAFDYDQDGNVDLAITDGHQFRRWLSGPFRMLRNTLPNSPQRRWLLVWVGNSPNRGATALHAVVKVTVGQGNFKKTTMLRVGHQGTALHGSYHDILHFGLGGYGKVKQVSVKWTNGQYAVKYGVTANRKVVMGIL